MSWRQAALALIAGTMLSAPLCGQAVEEEKKANVVSSDKTFTPRPPSALFAPENGASSNQLVVYFVVLIALAGGGLYVLKRGLPMRGARTGENRLHLLETKILGNRQFLVVVKYQDNKMLLGVGPGRIQYLCPLDSAEEDMEQMIQKGGQPPGAA